MAARRKGRGARVFAGLLGVLCWNAAVGQVEPPGSEPQVRISPQAGIPRPWEAGVSVSPWSVVNLYNGNVLTELTLTQFGPAGPAVRFTLFHNGAAANSGSSTPAPGGFSLGAGWTTSHGGAILDNEDDTVTLLEDDGNQYLFTLEGGSYQPEVGVHDRLVWESGASQWVLTRPDQWQRIFDDDGRLLEVRDAAGRTLTVERDAENGERIASLVAPEGGGELALEYDPNTGRLDAVTAVDEPNDPSWTFEYDGNDRLWKVHYPGEAEALTLAYNSDNRIVTITDASAAAWDLRYNAADRVRKAQDPPDPNTAVREEQLFSYDTNPQGGRWWTYYTDRRTVEWTYGFDVDGRFRERSDPNNNAIELTYDSDWNVTSLDDGASSTVTATWGPVATLATLSTLASPVEDSNQPVESTFYWEQPDPNGAPNFWRLVQIADTAGYSTQYQYEDPNDATRPTTLVDEDDLEGQVFLDGSLNPFPVTGLGHYQHAYWDHGSPWLREPAPIGRPVRPLEPAGDGCCGGVENQSPGANDWRYRFHWVVFPFGAHIGIDYNKDGTGRYLDYGQPPDQSGCTCCNSSFVFVNNRWSRTNVSPLSRSSGGYRTAWFTGSACLRDCFENSSSNGAPRNWTDSSNQCCRYYWLGWTPSGWSGNWSNSNGGALAAIHLCLETRCATNPIPHPPSLWNRFTPGWNNRALTRRDATCPGYQSTIPGQD